MEIPPVRYARSGDIRVFAPGTVSHLALDWDRPLRDLTAGSA
jgi:hypothetical protein